ncbi:MAG: hypothetical protein J7604_18735 [Sporocytophaga sp.]|uniref:hypothetical protein n=1 Tax=Sporocytophaga sp. TaxID=2231183 RepID=UPI001B25190E|nr:hypothetical protein [Sporocytophaga sp.]MBO9702253.1 hypothetical protein [Sporocytophaga sp.]
MKKNKFLLIPLLLCATIHVQSQDKYNISSEVFINGVKPDPQDTIHLNAEVILEIQPTGNDTLENLDIRIFITRRGKILNKIVAYDLSEFNERFDTSIFKNIKDGDRLYICLINKDLKSHNIIKLGNKEIQFDNMIMFPIKDANNFNHK